jgi:UDP-N-acetylmuramate--alanine ligase
MDKKIYNVEMIGFGLAILYAVSCLVFVHYLKIPEEMVFSVFKSYKGSWRRADYKGKSGGMHIYDDYAHHPTEINATLAGFREKYPLSRIWCVFQPHQEARLQLLFDDFSKAFSSADCVVLLDAYHVPGREHFKKALKTRNTDASAAPKTSFDLARTIGERTRKPIFYLQHANQLQRLLQENVFDNDIVIMMGAGNINEMTKVLVR